MVVIQVILVITNAIDAATATETLTVVLASICTVGWSVCVVLNSILFVREWKEWKHNR